MKSLLSWSTISIWLPPIVHSLRCESLYGQTLWFWTLDLNVKLRFKIEFRIGRLILEVHYWNSVIDKLLKYYASAIAGWCEPTIGHLDENMKVSIKRFSRGKNRSETIAYSIITVGLQCNAVSNGKLSFHIDNHFNRYLHFSPWRPIFGLHEPDIGHAQYFTSSFIVQFH